MRRLTALSLPLALAATLTACDLMENEPDNGTGNFGTGLRIGILTRPATTPQPGDTLTFYVTSPDSTSERVLIAWALDKRGEELLGGCIRAVCAKWIVPVGSATYQHSVGVANPRGQSRVPFTTPVP